ncbi:MAG TPA: ribonuclease HI [Deltaproteobacteria bacterium]|nr:ribonuclease HI [Deltaproteobacteria bacterium]
MSADTVVVFTDGACRGNPGPAGSGAVVLLPGRPRAEGCRSLGRATNNVAELTAVGLALDILDQAGVEADARVAILTDSDYTNGVLCRGWKAKANTLLIRGLRERLASRPGTVLHWVAGHVGIEGNERADALAGLGVDGQSWIRGLEPSTEG